MPGAVLGTLSAFGYAANVFVIRRLTERIGPARTISWHSLIAGVLLLPFVDRHALASAGAGRVALLIAGSVVLGALAGWLFLRGLQVIGSTRAAMLAFMEPLVAVVVGWLAWKERLGWSVLAGGALILGAGAWIALAPRQRIAR